MPFALRLREILSSPQGAVTTSPSGAPDATTSDGVVGSTDLQHEIVQSCVLTLHGSVNKPAPGVLAPKVAEEEERVVGEYFPQTVSGLKKINGGPNALSLRVRFGQVGSADLAAFPQDMDIRFYRWAEGFRLG